jgi:hypothetical protein
MLTLLAVAAIAAAPAPDPHPASCDGKPVAFHVHRAKTLIRKSNGQPTDDFRRHRRCVPPGAREHIKRAKQLAEVTPYPGPGDSYWAIPASIVACESGYSWRAANPSGAVGPYQLLGWGAPFPVHGFADRLAHHRIASRLYAGGAGRSQWVC